jgi:hypothetical protein
MTVHELKTDADVFQALLDGSKTCEVRINDRNFQVGDRLDLLEQRADHSHPEGRPRLTGRKVVRIISHVLEGYGLQPGHVALSFRHFGSVQLTALQLQEALDAWAPDRATDPDQLETEIGIGYVQAISDDHGKPGPGGLCCWDAEYPEEGVMPLFDNPASEGKTA